MVDQEKGVCTLPIEIKGTRVERPKDDLSGVYFWWEFHLEVGGVRLGDPVRKSVRVGESIPAHGAAALKVILGRMGGATWPQLIA